MADQKKLVIGLGLDNLDAKTEAKESVEDLKKVEKAAEKTADTQEKSAKKAGRAQRDAMAEALRELTKYLKAQDDANTTFSTTSTRAQDATKHMDRLGVVGGVAFATINAGVQKLLQGLGEVGAISDKLRAQQQGWADSFVSQQDRLAELAAIQDKELNREFVQQFAQFQKLTGMRPDEALTFQTELLNTGAQFVGKKIQVDEAEQYKELLAKLSLARGLAPEVTGGFGGTMLGVSDFTKFGDQAAETAAGRVNRALAMLGRGAGENKRLVADLTKLVASTVSENQRSGLFSSEVEVAALVSTIAQAEPESAEVYSRAALRGLRDFGGTGGKLLRKARITPQMTELEALQRLAPVVQSEAERRGLKTQDVLKVFGDERTAKGLAVLINEGIGKGVIQDRLQYGEKFAGPAPLLETIRQYEQSPRGMRRMADARVTAAELARGAQLEDVEILRKQVLARMIETGEAGSMSSEMQKFATGKLTWGMLGDQDKRLIDQRAAEALDETARRRGLDLRKEMGASPFANVGESGINPFGFNQEQVSDEFRQSMRTMRQRGVDPLRENPAARSNFFWSVPTTENGGDVAAAVERGVEKATRNQAPKTMTKATPGGGRAAVER